MNEKNSKLFTISIYFLLVLGSLIMMYPFMFQVLASIGSNSDYYKTVLLPIPRDLQVGRYFEVFTDPSVYRLYINTIFRCTWYIFVNILMAMLGGYVFSKLKFKGKNNILLVFLASMMIPGQVTLIPYYLMLARWPGVGGNNWMGQGGHGLVDNVLGLYIGGLIPVYFIFLMKQMLDTLPYEYEEAARIDGASTFRIIFQIYLPMVKPMLATIFILSFVGVWNDYLLPLVIISSPKYKVIATGIATLMSKFTTVGNVPRYPDVFCLATIAMLPPVLVYMIFQKQFVQGFAMTGVKG